MFREGTNLLNHTTNF